MFCGLLFNILKFHLVKSQPRMSKWSKSRFGSKSNVFAFLLKPICQRKFFVLKVCSYVVGQLFRWPTAFVSLFLVPTWYFLSQLRPKNFTASFTHLKLVKHYSVLQKMKSMKWTYGRTVEDLELTRKNSWQLMVMNGSLHQGKNCQVQKDDDERTISL